MTGNYNDLYTCYYYRYTFSLRKKFNGNAGP